MAKNKSTTTDKISVAIIMGSDSDLNVMSEAAIILEEFQVAFEILIVSAHRTPKYMVDFATQAHSRGLQVIIAGAGGAAHLPGMVASLTSLPVVGVPVVSKNMNGLDSLYSIVQMPPGIPVATMAINGAKNAGLMAIKILALQDASLHQKVLDYQKSLENMVETKNTQLQKIGFKKYIQNQKK